MSRRWPVGRPVATIRHRPELGLLGLGYVALLFITINTRQWFYADEWEVIVTRDRPPLTRVGDLLDMLFRPHNEHWITIPVIVYRAVFAVVGLREYWPYLVAHLAVHVLLGWMLIRRMRTDGAHVLVVLSLAALFLFYGPGAENILWSFQFVFMLSMIFGLLWLEILENGRPAADSRSVRARQVRLGWLFGIGALASSGIGLTVVFVVGLYTVLRAGWRRAAAVVSVPVIAHAAWFVTYGHRGAEATHIQTSQVAQGLIGYVWRTLMATVDETIGVAGLGPFFVLALVVATVVAWPQLVADNAAALALAAGAVFLPAVVAVGRVQFGDPEASRYLYLEFALVTPLVAIHLTRLVAHATRVGRGRPVGAALGSVFALSAVTCFGLLIHRASDEGKRERASRDQITAAFTVARSSFVSSRAFPEPGTIDLRMDDVRRLLDRGIQPRGRPTTRAIALVTARTTVDVTGQPRVPLAGNAVTIGSLGRATGVPAETGCIALTATGLEPQIGLLVHKPASLKFVPQSAGHLLIFVRRDGVAAPPIAVPVAGNNPVFVNFADPTAAYILQFPERGVSKLCGSGQVLPTSPSTSTSTSTPDPAATP